MVNPKKIERPMIIKGLYKCLSGSCCVQYRPPIWTHLELHSEAVEGFLDMLRFEHKNQMEKLSEVLK